MNKNKQAIFPFKSSSINKSDTDLNFASGYIPTFRLLIILTIFSCISILIFDWLWMLDIYPWYVDFFSLTPFFLIWIIGIGLIFIYFKLDEPLKKVSKSLFPIRLKGMLELFPIKSKNISLEFIKRLINTYYSKVDGKYNYENNLNITIKGKKKKHTFDFYFHFDDNFLSLFLITLFLIMFITLDMGSSLEFYNFTDPNTIIIFIISLMIFHIILILSIYKYFYFNYFIIGKYIKNKLTLKDINNFKGEINDIIKGKEEPYISTIITDEEIDNEIISYVQSNKGKIKEKYPITLIQRDNKKFKLIWTESFIS